MAAALLRVVFQLTFQVLIDGLVRLPGPGDVHLLAHPFKIIQEAPAHTARDDHIHILQGVQDAPVRMLVAMVVTVDMLMMPAGMMGESVLQVGPAADISSFNGIDQEPSGPAEMACNGHTVIGSNCDLHNISILIRYNINEKIASCPAIA